MRWGGELESRLAFVWVSTRLYRYPCPGEKQIHMPPSGDLPDGGEGTEWRRDHGDPWRPKVPWATQRGVRPKTIFAQGSCARGPPSALGWFGLPAHRLARRWWFGSRLALFGGARGSLVAASGRGGAFLRLVGLGLGG